MICLDSSFLIELIIANKPHHEKAHELKDKFPNETALINTTISTVRRHNFDQKLYI